MSDAKLKVITPLSILSYPHIANPQKANEAGKKDKFSATLIFTPQLLADAKEKAFFDALQKAAISAIAAKFGEANVQKLLASETFRKGFRRDWEPKGYPEGSIFINARTEQQPGCVYAYPDESGKPAKVPVDLIQKTFYPGAIVRASVTAFGYDNSGNKGVSFALNNIQFVRDGERLDNRVAAEDEFTADLTQAPANLEALL